MLGVTVPFANLTTSNEGLVEDDILWVRIVSGIISALSIMGALLIILSYVCYKDMRTRGREILCHMSLADFGVGCTVFIGTIVYFYGYIDKNNDCSNGDLPISCDAYRQLCAAQAFFDLYCTLAAFLLSMVLAFYVFILLVDTNKKSASKIAIIGYVSSWSLAGIVSLWLVLTDRLGSTRVGSAGWCTFRFGSHHIPPYIVFFGGNLWLIVTFFMILILYMTTHIHMRFKIREMREMALLSSQSPPPPRVTDGKFLFIPFAFLFLRIGGLIFDISFVYTDMWNSMGHPLRIVIYSCKIFGHSGQGLVNGILFFLFTQRLRQRIIYRPLRYIYDKICGVKWK